MLLILINDLSNWIILSIIVVFGAVIGSFLSFLSYRLLNEQSLLDIHSRCVSCRNKLTVFELIPIISWVYLQGKCKYCKTKISVRYLFIELTAILVSLSGYYLYGLNSNMLIWLLLNYVFLFMIITDLEALIVLDSAQISFLIIFGIYCYLHDISIFHNINSFILITCGVLIIKYGYIYFRKKDGIGWADIKFMMVASLFMSVDKIQIFLFLSGISGVIIGLIWQKVTKSKVFPFIPSLIFAFLVIMREIL